MARGGHGAERGGLCASVRGRWQVPSAACCPCSHGNHSICTASGFFGVFVVFLSLLLTAALKVGEAGLWPPLFRRGNSQAGPTVWCRVLKDPSGCAMEAGGGGTGRKERDPRRPVSSVQSGASGWWAEHWTNRGADSFFYVGLWTEDLPIPGS